MKNFINEINKEINILENISESDNSNDSEKLIANFLLKCWNEKIMLPNLEKFSNELFVSPSTISKFIKKHNLKKYVVLQFVFKINSMNLQDSKKKIINEFPDCIKLIKDAKRIILLGQGTSGLIVKQFYIQFVMRDFFAIYVEGVVDQIELIKNSTKNDLIICVSQNFMHKWVKDLLSSSAKKIVLTTKNIKTNKNMIILKPQIDYFIKNNEVDYNFIEFSNKTLSQIFKNLKK